MSKHIAIKAGSSEEENKKELGSFAPSFIWLLRDFYLDLEEDGQQVTARDYLEMALRNHVGSGPGVESKNLIRDSIRALFPERECVTLVRPCNDERMLQKLNTVDMADLRPEFTEGLTSLIDLINHRCQPKKVGSDILNGPALAAIAQAYVTAINEGAVPEIQTAWQNVAEAECRRVMENAESVYVKEFPGLADPCPPEDAPLLHAHTQALKMAVAAFEADAVGGLSIRQAHVTKLEDSTMRRFEEYKAGRFAEASARATELAGNIMDEIIKASEDETAPISTTLTSLDTGIQRFLEEAAGPEKTNLFAGLVKRALAGPLHAAHAAEVTAGEMREADLRAEGEKAVAAVELQLEQAKTAAADAATEAAKRESDLKQQAADELAASEKRATEAAADAAKVLADTQAAAHEQQVQDAEKLAAAQNAAQEKQAELERKAHEQEKAAAADLTAAKTAAAEAATAAAQRESDLRQKASEDLAAAIKDGADKLAAREKEANEAEKAAAKALAEAQQQAQEDKMAAAAELAAAEKKAQEALQTAQERYNELERSGMEKEKEAAQELSTVKSTAAEELAAAQKAAQEAQRELQEKLAATTTDFQEQLSQSQQSAATAAAEAATALSEAEKQALEYKAAAARDVGAMDEQLRRAKEEMEQEMERVKAEAEAEKAASLDEQAKAAAAAADSKVAEAHLAFQAQLQEEKDAAEEKMKQAEAEFRAQREALEAEMAAGKQAHEATEDKLFEAKKSREKRENEFAHELGSCHQELMSAQEALRAVMMKNEKLYTENFTMQEKLDQLMSVPQRRGFRDSMKSAYEGMSGFWGGKKEEDGNPLPGSQEERRGVQERAAQEEPPLPAAENIQAYVVRGGTGARPES